MDPDEDTYRDHLDVEDAFFDEMPDPEELDERHRESVWERYEDRRLA